MRAFPYFLALFPLLAQAGVVKTDISYGDHPLQKLDLYLPDAPSKAPVMVYIHGGGWAKGDKAAVGLKPAFFNGKGWIFVSVNYRLLPEGKHPANVGDVALALAKVHDQVAEKGGDPGKLFVMGHSAGAHLAALVATLASVGVPVHAVTDDPDAVSLLLLQGAASVRTVDGWADVPDVWRELRSAVIVTDLYLGDGETGLDLLAAVGRGPRSVVVTSHSHARQTLDRAATLVHAEGVIRTDTGAWQETLRATVLRMLDETTPYNGGDDDA
jgi:acetyl esterase/lipase